MAQEGCLGLVGTPHKITSLRTGEVVDPTTRTVVGEFRILCTGCGKSLDEIHSEAKVIRRGPRKKKYSAPEEPVTAPASPGGDLQKLD